MCNRVMHFADWSYASKQSSRITKKHDFWFIGSFGYNFTRESFLLKQSDWIGTKLFFSSWKELYSPAEWNWLFVWFLLICWGVFFVFSQITQKGISGPSLMTVCITRLLWKQQCPVVRSCVIVCQFSQQPWLV